MKVDYPATAVLVLIDSVLERVAFAKELSSAAGVKHGLFDLYQQVEHRLLALKSIIKDNGFSTEYTNLLAQTLSNFTSGFSRAYANYTDRKPIVLQEEEKPIFKNQQERDENEIRSALAAFISISDFFINLSFLTKDLVVIGANGSGKSSLASHLREHIKGLGIVISAQKALQLYPVDKLMSAETVKQELKKIQLTVKDRSIDFTNVQSEFVVLMQALLVDQNQYDREYKQATRSRLLADMSAEMPQVTQLERVLQLWNSIFSHLTLSLEDGLNLIATNSSNRIFAGEMSDGEKAALFYIAHVILCPAKGFVIVDEPEMYLHPVVCKRLWDRLEQERRDCIFIYLTHNLDFAVSRLEAKKIWIRKFVFPSQFEFESISPNEIPEPLLLELLGTRQNILFCEGRPGGLDENVYSVLFPEYAIKPVGGCSNVINFTKAFNKLNNITTKAVGLIDSDFHSEERLKPLPRHNIFHIRLPEVENILFDTEVLEGVCRDLGKDKQIPKIKEAVIKQLVKTREHQVSFYITTKINNFFEVSSVKRGDSVERVEKNFGEFLDQIKIKRWAEEQRNRIDEIVKNGNYEEAIRVFNFKSFQEVARPFLKKGNYNSLAIEAIKKNENLKKGLLKYFPDFPKTS